MKTLLAITMLIGAASFTSAYAEWEIVDPGTDCAQAKAIATDSSSATVERSEQAEVATK